MAVISSASSVIGIKEGSAWGTAVAPEFPLRVTQSPFTTSRPRIGSRAHNSRKVNSLKLGNVSTNVTLTGPATFGGHWIDVLAAFLGTPGTPTEQNGGEGDDLQTLDISNTNDAFFCVSQLAETDVVEEVASVKFSEFTLSGQFNGDVNYSFSGGIGTSIINTAGSCTTTVANLNALSFGQTEEDVVFDASGYVRIGDYSTSGALSSSDNMNYESFELKIMKPHGGARFAGNSITTLEPLDSTTIQVMLTVTFESVDDSYYDYLVSHNAETALMAELFADGAQIGAGANTSLKAQLPGLKILNPGNRGIQGQGTITKPQVQMEAYIVPAAAAGMSGFTYPRITTIDSRA